VIGGEIDQGHDFLASEKGKPLPKNRENGVEQIGSWPEVSSDIENRATGDIEK
jgi:hypothetical protein